MTDERYKQIMADLGMPNSHSLLAALKQVANEVALEMLHKGDDEWLQEARMQERERCAKVAAWILKMPENDVSSAIRAKGQ